MQIYYTLQNVTEHPAIRGLLNELEKLKLRVVIVANPSPAGPLIEVTAYRGKHEVVVPPGNFVLPAVDIESAILACNAALSAILYQEAVR